MNQGIKTIIYPIQDKDKATQLFSSLLGVKPHVDSPYYVGFMIGDMEIGLDPNGHKQGLTWPVAYYHVDDIQKCLQILLNAGGQVQAAVRDVGGGRLVAIGKRGFKHDRLYSRSHRTQRVNSSSSVIVNN